jgi:dienelactone hydrolase
MCFLLILLSQDSAVDRYLAERDPAARKRILAEIRAPIAEVEVELRKPPRRAEAPTGKVKKRLKADHPLAVEFDVDLWVPKGYTPARTWRLLVSLHGQGGNGEGQGPRWWDDLDRAGDTILVCPTAGRGGWGRSLLGHAYILTALRDAMATYAVDPDLVFLDGASMGGNGSFEFACLYPDRFAGAAPRSGGPLFRYLPPAPGEKERRVTAELLENLLPLPVYWVVGAKDPEVPNAWVQIARAQLEALKVDLTFREYPEGGHEWFPQEDAKVLEWMGTKRRDPYPRRVGLATQERLFNRSFWLEIAEFKGKEAIKRGFMDLEKKNIEDRTIFADMVQVRGELAPEANEIRVTAAGARTIRVYLHPKMVDLSKPVTVTVNGTKSRHAPKPSLETLLESARRDRGLLYTATVDVGVP